MKKGIKKLAFTVIMLMGFTLVLNNLTMVNAAGKLEITPTDEITKPQDIKVPESPTLPNPKDILEAPGTQVPSVTTNIGEKDATHSTSTPVDDKKEGSLNTSDGTDFWGAAGKWFSKGDTKKNSLNSEAQNVVDIFTDMVNVVGTTAIVLCTIFLGIKYMFGSVEAKANVKESLVTLLVACVFFFGWTAISQLLFASGDSYQFIFLNSSDATYNSMVGRIFNTATFIAQFLAIGAVIYVGVRYIISGADGRAELKAKSIVFLIGIILAFASTAFLGQVSKIINEALK